MVPQEPDKTTPKWLQINVKILLKMTFYLLVEKALFLQLRRYEGFAQDWDKPLDTSKPILKNNKGRHNNKKSRNVHISVVSSSSTMLIPLNF